MGFLQNDFRLTVTGQYEVITIDCIFCRNVVFGDWKHILQKKSIHNAIVQATDMQGVTGPTAGQFLIHDSLELFCPATHGDHPNQISLWISQSKIMRAVFTFITFQIWIWKIDKELIFDYVETTFPQHSILRV